MRKFTINTHRALAAAAVFATGLAGCSGSGTSPQTVLSVNPLSGKLQLSVGTANIFGDMPADAVTGLNVVTSFRQVSGQTLVGASETLVNTPTLTGPFKITAAAGTPDNYGATLLNGPYGSEIGGDAITATPQQAAGTYPVPSTSFGVSNGVFSSGIEPFNTTTVGGPGELPAGQPVSYAPNPVPLYDALDNASAMSADPNMFVPFGGPPAFDPNKTGRGTRDGQGEPNGLLGTEEGIDVFQGVGPTAGAYSLSVVIPTSETSNGTVTASANLGSTALLPAIAPPATATTDGTGGASFAVVLPTGVTEAYVQIVDIGPSVSGAVSCNGSSASVPTYYTIEATSSGTYTLADAIGPVGKPSATSPSLCTPAENTTASASSTFTGASDGDQFTVQLVGFDYPAIESSALNSLGNSAPTLAGANGQSDITVSSQALYMQAASTTGGSIKRIPAAEAAPTLRAFAKRFNFGRRR